VSFLEKTKKELLAQRPTTRLTTNATFLYLSFCSAVWAEFVFGFAGYF
jgi:hypothetical protein